MSVCIDSGTVLANAVGTTSSSSQIEDTTVTTQTTIHSNVVQVNNEQLEQPAATAKNVAKLVVPSSTSNSTNTVLQKVVNQPLITVLNSSGPLTVVKSLCVTSGVSSAPQFTLVNSAPLSVVNAVGKPPTITLLNAPVTVVKAISTQNVEKTSDVPNTTVSTNVSPTTVIENRGHNVFVKNTCPDSTVPDMPQSHKILTASNFPQANVLANVQNKTANGQRNKLKILSNIQMMPGTSSSVGNVLLNKSNNAQRYVPRTKLIGANGATTKYLNKPNPNNVLKASINPPIKHVQDKSPQRMVYPTHKSQIKTLTPNYVQKPQGIKTLSPQPKPVPGQVQRSNSGLRTIPPQRPPKLPNKPNYIGKHAVQAQKMRPSHKIKNMKVSANPPYNFHGPPIPEKQLTFNQALTAEIIETLSNKSATPNLYPSAKHYEILPTRYDNAYSYQDHKPTPEPAKATDDKSKSGLDALSLICQAVLLDHNYNATLPPESPTRSVPPPMPPSQVNGMSGNSMYSPGSGKRRSLTSSNTLSTTSSLSNMSIGPSNSSTMLNVPDDDAASDVSDVSDRKHDTEGEETDTAPEAEAVTNEHYGDYVTRCICGFLHDDGYMVECDRCKVWQHVQCVVKNKQVPDEYLCEVCDPSKPIEKQKARMIQQQWLRNRQLLAESKLKKDIKIKDTLKHREVISDTDSSDGEHPHNNNIVSKRTLTNRRKSESKQQPNSRTRRDSTKEVVQRRQKRRERKIVKRKVKPAKPPQSDDENQDGWSSHLPQLRQWIEKYEEAVTNHYSPELRARISNIRVNGAHSDLSMQFDCTVQKCRVHTQPLTELKYLVSTVHLPPNTPVVELRGKYMLSTQHRNAGGSLTTRQHSQRPGPFLFFYRLHKDNTEVCVDTRTYGNSARFIRRSCKPNAELRHCIEKGVLHLYIVSIADVDKNSELTIKHESHDLAVIGTTQISCACGTPDECALNKTTIKKNGETTELHRKRRGRRTTSVCVPIEPEVKVKEEVVPPAPESPTPPIQLKQEPPEVKEEVKVEVKLEEEIEVKEEPLQIEVKEEVKVKKEIKEEPEVEKELPEEVKHKEEEIKSPPHTPIMTRRSSHYKSDKEDSRDGQEQPASSSKPEKANKCKKLSREERKLEAILRAIEQMEKAEQRKQEHEAKAQHRRESEPGPNPKEEEKVEPRMKRRRRKGRARTTSTNASTRRNRLNSTDSYLTSGDETLLSPTDNACSRPSTRDSAKGEPNDKAVGLLLALSNGDNLNKNMKSPTRDVDSNSNSTHSSPETQLSSACLLVQAAVEPLEPGFKFPKTKKGLMNEWLNKVPEPVQSASSISPSSLTPHVSSTTEYENTGFYSPAKNLVALAQAATYCDTNVQPRGNAKKRWLRQAISEDHSCDSPQSRPDSPPLSDMVAPPKKRRLPRESLSNEASPPSTPTSTIPPNVSKLESNRQGQEGCVEIVYSGAEGDSPTQTLECDAVLKERAAQMKQEFNKCIAPPSQEMSRAEIAPMSCLLDPRLARDTHPLFSNSDHLVGTVEKTLSILGFEDRRPDAITPAKRKLSITEYRQRKKLNNNEKNDEPEPEQTSNEENNSSESFRATRQRSGSTSSSTSITSSDDDTPSADILPGKALSAFNSEPTELERQRESSSLRLKKAFGLALDDEPRKSALDVEAILNCELPLLKPVKPPPSPTFPIPGSCEVTRDVPSPMSVPSPVEPETPPPPPPPQEEEPMEVDEANEIVDEEPAPVSQEVVAMVQVTSPADADVQEDDVKPNMFYIPDEEEDEPVKPTSTVYDPSGRYVPAFNNPAYSNNKLHISSIDDDARYEGRNPSPPPHLGADCE